MRSAASRSQSASSPAGLRRTWRGAPRRLTGAYIGPSFRRRWIALSLDSPGARDIGIDHGDRPRETRTTAAHLPHRPVRSCFRFEDGSHTVAAAPPELASSVDLRFNLRRRRYGTSHGVGPPSM